MAGQGLSDRQQAMEIKVRQPHLLRLAHANGEQPSTVHYGMIPKYCQGIGTACCNILQNLIVRAGKLKCLLVTKDCSLLGHEGNHE